MQDVMVLTESLKCQLASVSVSTLTHQLQTRGINNAFLTGLTPLHRTMRLVGRARTVRYVALREDVQRSYSGAGSAQQKGVETIEPGEVLVIEARGAADAGTIGDMYSTRAFIRGAAGIVSDGALRDTPAITALNKPVYHQGSHGATLGRRHMPFSFNEPITCAGVFVVPGDVIVGDGEGAVVIPAALAAEVVRDAIAQEEVEAFALERIAAGESSFGLFPLASSRRDEFTAWAKARNRLPAGTGPSQEE
jgi:5-oxopent-3-ene-1,2,5-tricarboxylate decarboxylase / 2-hydroxyhepta-2,4-diene-1,7-dioate isomerase